MCLYLAPWLARVEIALHPFGVRRAAVFRETHARNTMDYRIINFNL
jgi:hypothetical protein